MQHKTTSTVAVVKHYLKLSWQVL